ncbi:hypothetical protein A8709_32965 [Paenibacillus pectinilyticus]|uniref:Portal protein n=1 Tax=Paenibacillus pectinilyticus TaxID=512399 RepID=A0A1C0ZWX9_9BACL|nr:hypothetical protein [Paenibacillus pectinilyticus]OCT12623.1 hypothetical protein A8709_32965 [Paenibacillus pectinilyticus]
MAKTIDKPKEEQVIPEQTEKQKQLAQDIQDMFRGAYQAKDQMDLMNIWARCDDYMHNIQNEPETEEDPGSVTNIIKPIIDSEISDIVDKPFSVDALGREPSDHMFSDDVQHALNFVLDKNKFKVKLTHSEHDRLELGTTVVKVYTDHEALNGRGLPTFEIVSPANFFPDPKWTASHLLQECEFIIHAVPRPLSWIRRMFPKWGKYVKRQVSWPYDPTLDLDTTRTDEVSPVTSQKALLIECYMRDENGDIFCVHVANNIVLEDSRDDGIVGEKLQRRNQFPFEVIICFPRRGTGWGMGDVEYLFPTQDLINDMDDQIIMTARLMGNPQMAIGLSAAGKGFDARKWTNKPGLRIPFRDVTAFKPIVPVNVSSDIPNRREKAFEEANIISGRPDVNRGNTPGSGVTAASAIIALQQAGQKTVVHKTEMLKQGWTTILELLYDEMVTNWNEAMWVRINGDKPDFKFIDPTKLSEVPIMIPNLEATADNGMDTVKQLLDDSGAVMTRNAEFDLRLSLGNGLPTDKAFIYQTLLDLAKLNVEGKAVISWQELRNYLRDQVGIPLQADSQLQNPANPMAMQPGMPPPQGMPMGAPQPTPAPAMMPPQLNLMQGGAPR